MAAMGGAEGLGHRSIKHLVKFFGSAQAAWSADAYDLIKSGLKKKQLEAFVTFRHEYPNAPEKLVGYCERQKINLCCILDEDYPPLLKEIDTPPMFFYYRGQLQPHAQRIGIVGSRNNTRYGQTVALELGEELAAAGLTVVSGAARGIDTFAHRGALKSGRTVAVLGCGINFLYPLENKKLFEQIVERGVVLSEFPPQLPPNSGTFPARNRIIAGLSRGVVVVEAGVKSGALITGDFAAEYGRDVFAIPGKIHEKMSVGCHELIREGATLIKDAKDILDEYNLVATAEDSPQESTPALQRESTPRSQSKPVELEGTEAEIFEVIPKDGYITADEILDQLDEINPSELPDIMLKLELKGCVEEDAGRYKRKC